MGGPLSLDPRSRVVAAVSVGMSRRQAAADDLWDAIRNALPTFTPQDCISYFTAAGYEPH